METISILKKYRFFDSSSNDFTTKHYVNAAATTTTNNSTNELVPIGVKLETTSSRDNGQQHASMYNWGYGGGAGVGGASGAIKQHTDEGGELATTKRLISNTNRPITTIGRQNSSFYVNKQSLIKPSANSSSNNNILFKLSTNLNRTSPGFDSSTPGGGGAKSNSKLVPISVVNMNSSNDFKSANHMISSSYFNNYFTNSALTNFDNHNVEASPDTTTNYAKLIRKNSTSNALVRGPYQKSSAKPVKSAANNVNFKSASSYLDSNNKTNGGGMSATKKQPSAVYTNYYFYNNASSSPSSSSNINHRGDGDAMNEEKKKSLITNYLKRSMAKWSTSNNNVSQSCNKFNSISSTRFSNKSYSNLNKFGSSKNVVTATNSTYFNDVTGKPAAEQNLESSSLIKSNNNFQTSLDLDRAESKLNLLKMKRPGSRQQQQNEFAETAPSPVSPPPPRPKSRSQVSPTVRVKTAIATTKNDDKSLRREEATPSRVNGRHQPPVIAERQKFNNQAKESGNKSGGGLVAKGNYDMSVNITSINENIRQRMKLTGENGGGDTAGAAADDDNIDWAAEEQAYLASVNKKCNEWLEKYVLPFLDVAARQHQLTSSPSSSSMFDDSPFLN